jgi:hypothetical protein
MAINNHGTWFPYENAFKGQAVKKKAVFAVISEIEFHTTSG